MEKDGLQRTQVRVLLTVLTAAMMILIFLLSREPAEKSDMTSGRLSMFIISVFHADYEELTPDRQEWLYNEVQHYVRKTAHFSEYMILGVLLRLCIESWFGKKRFTETAAWGAGAIYACTDELHQLAIDGRSGQFSDVLIDSCGVLAGVFLAMLIRRYIARKGAARHAHEHRPGES